MSTLALPLPRIAPVRAGRAIAALLRDPDDLPQVFTILESLSGTAPHRMLRRFDHTSDGQRLLRDQPDIVPRLADRETLRGLPAGTLGRAYLAFVESEGISAEGIRAAAVEGESGRGRPEAFRYLHDRLRDTHDLWHAATGYKGDIVGELALLGFILGQNWNLGIAFIVLSAVATKPPARRNARVILEGYLRGRRAAWLPAQDWESLLAVPVDEVRRRLGLGAPAEYVPVRTSELAPPVA